jgi:hypothetical protein
MVEGVFSEGDVERWDAPLLELPDRQAVREYLIGKGLNRAQARRAADSVETPLQVTKRGSLLFARKR